MQTKHIVLVVVVSVLYLVTTMALVTRFLLHKHPKHAVSEHTLVTDDKTEQQPPVTPVSFSLKRLLTLKQNTASAQWLPNMSAIVKAGDEGMISSLLFLALDEQDGQNPLDGLYQKFASEIRTHSTAERNWYTGDMAKFVARMKNPTGGLNRSKSTSQLGRAGDSVKARRKSMDPSILEIGRSRSLMVKRSAPPLLSVRDGLQSNSSHQAVQKSWTKEGQKGMSHEGRTAVTITSLELTALSIILGSEPHRNAEKTLTSEAGAYGISIAYTHKDKSKYHVSLTQNKRSRSQRHARGSGVSPLFAKHLALGSLPFSQDNDGIHSILITEETFNAIQGGALLNTQPSKATTPQSRLLASLPNLRDLKFHAMVTSAETPTSTALLDAIAALPFSGGLAPLASAPLIKTVQFVASGGLPPGKLLQRLEGLIDKVHRHSPQLDIFGPLYEPRNAKALYRERARLSKLDSDPMTPDTRADKTARMSRYITLLERLMALVPNMKPNDVLRAVEEATKVEIKRSYDRDVSTFPSRSGSARSAEPTPLRSQSMRQSKRHSMPPRYSLARGSNRSTSSHSTTHSDSSHFSSNDDGEQTLVKQLEQVLKLDLPLDITTIAFVARMVLVAWTLSVDVVAWGNHEQGDYRVPDLEGWRKIVMS